VSILPLVTNVSVNYHNLVPATTNFILSLQFNRAWIPTHAARGADQSGGGVQATCPGRGPGAHPQFRMILYAAPITFSTGMDGQTPFMFPTRGLGMAANWR